MEENDSQNGITTYTYDKAGNLMETVSEGEERHYIYDASDRLTAVTDKDTLLLAALYDGNDNRIFTMEYAPELQRANAGGSSPAEEESGKNRSGIKASDSLSDNTVSADTLPDTDGQSNDTDGEDTTEENDGSGPGRFAEGAKAFWYGVLCQTADIFLPAPTPFKAWLHDTMGFTDDLDVLFTEEVYEVQLAESNLTVKEAGSPFALIENVFAGANQQGIAADAYRQVTYLNDTTYENTQVLMEYAVNGSLGSTTTAYSFGVQRESFVETASGMGAGAAIGGMTYQGSGTYYYTGTGSVANVTGSVTNQSYSYTTGGSMTAFAMSTSAGNTTGTLTTNPTAYGTYGVYGYNGEYTHTNLGLQYLRARYLNVATGTFTSKDTYAGRMQDILSQNRYTYAENNPVGHSDPSGHAVSTIIGGLARNLKATVGNIQNRIHGPAKSSNSSTRTRALVATANSVLTYVNEQRQKLPSNKVDGSEANVSWPAIIAQNLERAMCESYDGCVNYTQEKIQYVKLTTGAVLFDELLVENEEIELIEQKDENRILKEDLYCSNEYLKLEQMQVNATYIHDKLIENGWSENAIAALFANMQQESTINPRVWQNLYEDKEHKNGFGLAQWSPATKYLDWAEENNLDPYDIDSQILRLEYEVAGGYAQWNSSKNSRGMSFSQFVVSTEDTEVLTEIFYQSYEQPPESDTTLSKRKDDSVYWYNYFN